jgi:hypothetical protein
MPLPSSPNTTPHLPARRVGTAFVAGLAAVVGGLAVAVPPARVAAQIMHLPPVHRRTLPAKEPVMVIRVAKDEYKNVIVSVDDDQVTIQLGAVTSTVPLGNRQIRDVMNQIAVDTKDGLGITSNYPLYPASYAGSRPAKTLAAIGDTAMLVANADEPDLRIGFGLVMALAEPNPDQTDGGILTQAGFQLDVVGTHQMVGPPPRGAKGWALAMPLVYTQWRLGLNADQQIQVDKDPETGVAPNAETQFQTALQQADQVAVSGQMDLEFPNVVGRLALVVTPSIGLSWTRLQAPSLPSITVGTERKAAADLFTADEILRARTNQVRIQPLREVGLMGTLQYRRRGVPAYYVGAGYMRRELARPTLSFRRQPPPAGSPAGTPPGAPIQGTLTGGLNRVEAPIWRATMGTRLAGVLDVRLDASGSWGTQRTEPLLRLLLARAFPIGG